MQSDTPEDFKDYVFNRYMRALEQIEWGQRSHLALYQQELLQRLLQHAYEEVPFYRDRLDCLFSRDGAIDFTRWSEVPIVTRAEAAAHTIAMRSSSLPEIYGEISLSSTSGTTGPGLQIATNGLMSIATNAAFTRLARWWDVDTSRPLARIRLYQSGNAPQYPDGADSKGWSGANRQALTHNLDLLTPIEQQIDWLLRKKARYLMTSPSNALALAYTVTAEQTRELALEAIFSIAETILPRAREVIAERLGARLIAIYSCQEIGFIATQCPATDAYHVVAENVLVEILRNDGTAAKPGEIGQVVLTSLYNYAMPFIRYAIGDVATVGAESCRCGRSLPLIAQVDGRTRHAFVFSDGSRVLPRYWVLRDVQQFVPCRELQLAQIDHERIEVRYVPEGGRAPDQIGLCHYIRTTMHPTARAILMPMEAIPRGPGGKLDPFTTLIAH